MHFAVKRKLDITIQIIRIRGEFWEKFRVNGKQQQQARQRQEFAADMRNGREAGGWGSEVRRWRIYLS